MSSKRRRSGGDSESSIKNAFVDLKETSLVQTGPKRPKTNLHLTPSSPLTTPANKSRRGRRKSRPLVLKVKRQSSSGGRGTQRGGLNEALQAATSLMDAAGDMSNVLSARGSPIELSPNTTGTLNDVLSPQLPVSTDKTLVSETTPHTNLATKKRNSSTGSVRRRSLSEGESPIVQETPVSSNTPRSLRSALKDIQSLSDIRSSRHSQSSESSNRVSFGPYVTVAEFSPDRSVGSDNANGTEMNSDPLQDTEASVDIIESSPAHSFQSPGHTHPVKDHTHQSLLEPFMEENPGGESDDELGGELDEPRLRTPQWNEEDEREETESDEPIQEKSPVRDEKKAAVRKPSKSAQNTLPRALIRNLFGLACKRRLTKQAMDLVMTFSEVYLKQASKDVTVFARHAGRKTVEVTDILVLLQRQREISSSKTFEFLVNNYLPMEYVEELLPCAKAEQMSER